MLLPLLSCRAVEASTLRKLNQQLSAEPAKSVPDALWLPPNGGLQMLGDAFAKAGCKVCRTPCFGRPTGGVDHSYPICLEAANVVSVVLGLATC